MIASIYARKSTEQTGLADEQKSVARQIAHARQYAARKGWIVADEHIYIDDGVSGAEFSNRPGFVRLMNAIDDVRKRRGSAFQVLIVSDLDRIGREQLELGYMLKQMAVSGIQIFTYLDDKEVAVDSPIATFMMQAQAFGATVEREKAQLRTRDALQGRARAGHCTGGRTFGFDNFCSACGREILPGERRGCCTHGHTARRINECEAAVVRRIFELCAGGDGLKGITKILNADRAQSPRSQRGRPQAWAPSSVRAVLYRESYRGLLIYNKTCKRNQWGQKAYTDRPSTDWIRAEADDLRIVPEALWQKAHARLAERRENYRIWTRSDASRTPEARGGRRSYLLSGFASCGCCGGSVQVISRASTTGRLFRYGCGQYAGRGATVCDNTRLAKLDLVDEAIRDHLATEVLNPARIEAALDQAIAMLKTHDEPAHDQQRLARRLRDVERTLENLTETAAKGGAVPAVLEALNRAEAERRALLAEMKRGRMANVSSKQKATAVNVHDLRRTLSGFINNWHATIQEDVAGARGLLDVVLRERITFTPKTVNGMAMYELKIPIGFDRLLVSLVPGLDVGFSRVGLASPTGTGDHWTAEFTNSVLWAA